MKRKIVCLFLFVAVLVAILTSCGGNDCKHDDSSKIIELKGKNPTCQEDGFTWGIKCLACDEMLKPQTTIPKVNHSYSEWEEIISPTFTSAGLGTRKCIWCDDAQTQELPSLMYEGEEVTITFHSAFGFAARENLQKAIERFNEIYPNIKVDCVNYADNDDLYNSINIDLRAGFRPNIAICYPDHLVGYGKSVLEAKQR